MGVVKAVNSILLLLVCLVISPNVYGQFSFIVVSDQRFFAGSSTAYDNTSYFRGAVEAMLRTGKGAFILSPGDIEPPQNSSWTIEQVLGSDYQWYPVVGNHELPGRGVETYYGENMEWLRTVNTDINGPGNEPDIVRYGPGGCPETTYSFDYQNSHFVILNEYCDLTGDSTASGDITDHLYQWLEQDLLANAKEHIFVFGHEPAFPQPDLDNGRFRYGGSGLNKNSANRDRFWSLLHQQGVVGYFCGHTHNFSAVKIDGVWQIDSGHARGLGDLDAPSTFLRVDVEDGVSVTALRDTHGGTYDYNDIQHNFGLAGVVSSRLQSFQNGSLPSSRYSGAKDTTLSQETPHQILGGLATLYADGDDPAGSGKDLSALLYWDIASIPKGSVVKEVSISLRITDITLDNYELHGITRPWVEGQANWYRATSTSLWEEPGAQGTLDRGVNLVGAYSPGCTGDFTFFLNRVGVDLIQSWVDNTGANNGIIFSSAEAVDGVNFSSSEATDPSIRPKLTVTYSYLAKFQGLPWLNLLLLDWQ